MFATRIFALVAFAVAVSAGCGEGQTGVCNNYTVTLPVQTPRGYSATDCTAASECTPKQYHMCCQSLSVRTFTEVVAHAMVAYLGSSMQGHTASVCSEPTQGGQ
ncbi:hypothetical protein BV22DRAFT_1038117 [Leucogyrophana mollusca]|uniref:Uncharacterized protein n=1 Tax=Leucogyrophana mollusca TaxID=85980 RepID=A0ACB8B7S9_9AGAM|nr:hypothetical protein BV22DRAFT_1038117 [Leucogyrophana mollusca]